MLFWLSLLTVLFNIGTPQVESCSTPFMMSLINFSHAITAQMEPSSSLVVKIRLLECTMNKQEAYSSNLKVEVLVNQVTVIECFAQSFVQMIQIWSSLEVGIITSKFGTLENHLQLDLLSVLTSAVIPSIFTMDIFSLVNILTLNNFNFGISEHVNQSKISAGMRAYHQRNHVSYMPRNFRKTLEISLSLVVPELMKSKFSTETTCLNLALKSEISVELPSPLISATVETCSPLVVVMVSSESSMLSMMYDSYVICYKCQESL